MKYSRKNKKMFIPRQPSIYFGEKKSLCIGMNGIAAISKRWKITRDMKSWQ